MANEEIKKLTETNEILSATLEDQNKEIKLLKSQVEQLTAESSKLKAEASPKKRDTPKCPTVKIGKDSYTFRLAVFSYNGADYIAEDIVKDTDFIKELVENAPSLFANPEKS